MTSTPVLLSDRINQLGLCESRLEVKGPPSQMTDTKSELVGWTAYNGGWNVDRSSASLTPLEEKEHLVKDILAELTLQAQYFNMMTVMISQAVGEHFDYPQRPAKEGKSIVMIKGGFSLNPEFQRIKIWIPKADAGFNDASLNIGNMESVIDLINGVAVEHVKSNLEALEHPFSLTYEVTRVDRNARSRSKTGQTTDKHYIPITLRPSATLAGETPTQASRRQRLLDREPWGSILLITADPKSSLSEMSVRHVVGSRLRFIFQLPNCDVSSDRIVDTFRELKMSSDDSKGKPDFAAVRIPAAPLPDILAQPVFAVGEAKQSHTGAGANPSPNQPNFRAQMQAAIYPIMVMLILIYEEQHRRAAVRPQLSRELIIYGTYLDEGSVKLYAHFPYWDPTDDEGGPGWRFAQVLMGEYTLAHVGEEDDKGNAPHRWQLTVALITARAHSVRLAEYFDEKLCGTWAKICNKHMVQIRPNTPPKDSKGKSPRSTSRPDTPADSGPQTPANAPAVPSPLRQ